MVIFMKLIVYLKRIQNLRIKLIQKRKMQKGYIYYSSFYMHSLLIPYRNHRENYH